MNKHILIIATWGTASCFLTAQPIPEDAIAEAKAAYKEKAPSTVTGIVFLDANANGKRDGQEKGIAGVAVTDGVDIVKSGDDGSYRITIRPDATTPWTPARTVSICWPDGHWPVGKHWHRLSDIPDGKNADFALRPDKQTLPFAFSHITDDHGSGGTYQAFSQDYKLLGGMSKFIVDTGDMLYANYSVPAAAIGPYKTLAANIKKADFGVSLFGVPGNHDNVGTTMKPEEYDPAHPLFCHGLFTRHIGPVRWSFDYGGCHFVGLDWKQPATGMEKWENIAPQEAVDWFAKDLTRVEENRRVFVFIHFPTGVGEYHKLIGRASWSFGGHAHRYRQYNYGGPSTVGLNLRGNGSSNLVVVTKDDFVVVARCPGCKADRNYHSKDCAIAHRTKGDMSARMAPIRGEPIAIPAQNLGTTTIDSGGAGIEIEATIAIGSAKQVGLKIGEQEVVYEKGTLYITGIPVPFEPWPEQNNTLTLHIAASSNMLMVHANNLIRILKPAKVGDASKVTLFAEGGDARLDASTIRALNAEANKVLENMGFKD